MGTEVQAAGGPGRRRRRGERQIMSQINVTPFVDVMLVLLIIFMITAPLLTAGVPVDLPQAGATPLQGEDEPLAVSIRADGSIYLQDSLIALDDLAPRLTAIAERNPNVRIFVRGDKAIAYGRVMEVMGTLNEAGFNNIALVTQLRQGKETSKK